MTKVLARINTGTKNGVFQYLLKIFRTIRIGLILFWFLSDSPVNSVEKGILKRN